jgi:hypothetical protein
MRVTVAVNGRRVVVQDVPTPDGMRLVPATEYCGRVDVVIETDEGQFFAAKAAPLLVLL